MVRLSVHPGQRHRDGRGGEPRSEALAKELSGLLQQHQLDAISAVDPADPSRFVAALYFPGQLLVISARYAAPAVLVDQMQRKAYRDVYTTLQGASEPSQRLFIQDIGADGIHAGPGETVDVMYEGGVTQTIFDGRPEQHKLSKTDYSQRFGKADQRYSRLLTLLITQTRNR